MPKLHPRKFSCVIHITNDNFNLFGSRSCRCRSVELVSSAMDEQWLESWPVVFAIATRKLTATVSEMQQQNGVLRQRTSYLDLMNEELRHELACTKESLSLATSNMSDEQKRQCACKGLYESGAGDNDAEWHAPRDSAGARNAFEHVTLCSNPLEWLSSRDCRACKAPTLNRCHVCKKPLCPQCSDNTCKCCHTEN